MPGASLCRDRLPVCDATAVPAADRAQCPVPLNVGLSRIRSGFDRHRAPLKIHPWAADPAAQRAVAGSSGLRRGRQSKADGATVTRTLMHCQNLPLFPKCSQPTPNRTSAARALIPRLRVERDSSRNQANLSFRVFDHPTRVYGLWSSLNYSMLAGVQSGQFGT